MPVGGQEAEPRVVPGSVSLGDDVVEIPAEEGEQDGVQEQEELTFGCR